MGKKIKIAGVGLSYGGPNVKEYLKKVDIHFKKGDEIISDILSKDNLTVTEEYGIAIRNTFEYQYRMSGYKFRSLLKLIWDESFGKIISYFIKNNGQK